MSQQSDESEKIALLSRIADALDRLAPIDQFPDSLEQAEGYFWQAASRQLQPIAVIQRLPLDCLCGIEPQKQLLLDNSRAFARGRRANNALLWGARGTGKSSLLKAVHGQLLAEGLDCAIIEIAREDIADLPLLMEHLSKTPRRFIIFCDDLAFEEADSSYKSLKAALEGGLAGRPDNIVFYATSNRRHLMPRQMIENERGTAINPSEAAEEKISLSDRFGLWIGFHSVDQDSYLEMIKTYIAHFGLPVSFEEVRADALAWAMGRGNRSGRTAFHFILDLAARLDVDLPHATGEAGGA